MYVFHIASLYDRRGDGAAGADMLEKLNNYIVRQIKHCFDVSHVVYWLQIQQNKWRQTVLKSELTSEKVTTGTQVHRYTGTQVGIDIGIGNIWNCRYR